MSAIATRLLIVAASTAALAATSGGRVCPRSLKAANSMVRRTLNCSTFCRAALWMKLKTWHSMSVRHPMVSPVW